MALQALDTQVLEGRLPAAIFYNLLMSARLPDEAARASSDRAVRSQPLAAAN